MTDQPSPTGFASPKYGSDQGNPKNAIPVYITSGPTPPAGVSVFKYVPVAASTTATLGPTGAVGDTIDLVIIAPTTTAPGPVSIKDGAGASIPLFTGGAGSINSLAPIIVPLDGVPSVSGAWSITTGANMTVLVTGRFKT
jgi:hypothetical protein